MRRLHRAALKKAAAKKAAMIFTAGVLAAMSGCTTGKSTNTSTQRVSTESETETREISTKSGTADAQEAGTKSETADAQETGTESETADVQEAGTKSETADAQKADTEAEASDAQAAVRTITDHAGNEVELPKEINRIAVTDTLPLPSVLTMFLGSADKLVGISPVSMSAAKSGLLGELYPEILNADTSFFTGNELNIESLLKLKPDIVFYNAGSTQIADALKAAGLTAVAVSVTNWDYDAVETYNAWIELLEDIFPEREGLAKTVSDYSDQAAELIDERVGDLEESEKKRVFFLFNYTDTAIVTSGEKFWGQFWCDAAHAVNVGQEMEEEKSNAVVNMEQVYEWNPDVIFISNFTTVMPEDLYENKVNDDDWSSVSAVKDKEVYKMPLGAYRTFTPGADTPMTMLWIAKTLYPDQFDDIDMTAEVEDYYSEVYGVELTDEQVAKMYEPSAAAAAGYSK